MSETVNQEQGSEKTFTQADLDRIVGERLSREREKFADYDAIKEKASQFDAFQEAQKSELEKATERANQLQAQIDKMTKADKLRQLREKISTETGVPAGLLSGETEEACKEQANAILSFAKPTGYPQVKDAGETKPVGGGKTRDQFSEWFNASLQK